MIQKLIEFWFGLPDFVRRPIRTFAQVAGAGVIAALGAFVLALQGGEPVADAVHTLLIAAGGAALAGIAAVISFFQNLLETKAGVRQ
jgi:hypothetical protein